METLLVILVLASGFVALVAAVSALWAGLRLRRARIVLRIYLSAEVARLAGRATELEKKLTALDVRAQALPVRIAELQQNLITLRILTNALVTSLRQAQRFLSSTSLKSSLAKPLAEAFGTHTQRSNGSESHAQRGEAPQP